MRVLSVVWACFSPTSRNVIAAVAKGIPSGWGIGGAARREAMSHYTSWA